MHIDLCAMHVSYDSEMHQTKKGNEWYFGMIVHAGADAGSGYVHSLTSTSANMHDVSETSKLMQKDEHNCTRF